jgi:WD40 repeat protein
MAFSPDGQMIVSGSEAGELYLWDARNGQRVLALRNSGPISDIAFSRRGDVLFALTLPHGLLVLDAGLPSPSVDDPLAADQQ